MDITLPFIEIGGVIEGIGCVLDFGNMASKYSFS
jgi:hypothetical protein